MTNPQAITDASLLTQYGVSEELVGSINCLRSATSQHGDGGDHCYKYRDKDVDQVARILICRNYGKSCLALCYLLLAVIHRNTTEDAIGALLGFFYIEESISPARFRKAFVATMTDGDLEIVLDEQNLRIHLDDKPFHISPAQVRFLAALLDWLVYVEPRLLEIAAERLQAPSSDAVTGLASEIQKIIYAYLSEHMQSAQQQRRLRCVYNWILAHCPDRETLNDCVTDAIALAFWQDMATSTDTTVSHRRFRTVAEDFIGLKIALSDSLSRHEVLHAAPIGQDADAGEWNPEHLFQALEQADASPPDLSHLTSNPKFLTKKDVQPLAPLIQAGNFLHELPLTLLRMETFGHWQDKIIQARKSRQPDRLAAYLEGNDILDYETYREQVRNLVQTLEDSMRLGLGLFLELHDETSLSVLADLLDPETLMEIRTQLSDDESGGIADDISQRLAELRLRLPALNRLCDDARQRLKKTSRAGFKPLPSREALAPYIGAMETLRHCRKHTARYQNWLSSKLDPVKDFSADLSIFKETCSTIYGDAI